MKEKLPILFAAAFGGISPNLLRLAVNLMGENPVLPELTYVVGLAIFALMGSIVAWIWEETDFKKAFYLGIGLPAVIQMGAGEISKNSTAYLDQMNTTYHASLAVEERPFFSIRAAGYFQEQQPRQLTLSLEKYWPRCQVVFSAGDSTVSQDVVFPPRKMSRSLAIPDFATEFHIEWRRNKSVKMTIPAESEQSDVHYLINTRKPIWSGLMVAIGLRTSDELEISLKQVKEGT